MTRIRGEVFFANDGILSTNHWRSSATEDSDSKPWLILEFEKPQTVDRLVISSNKHYFLETDYLSSYKPQTNFKFSLEVLGEDGSWQTITSTEEASALVDAGGSASSNLERIQDLITAISEEGPQPSFVGQFIEPVTSYVFHRGSPENPKNEVYPAGFDV